MDDPYFKRLAQLYAGMDAKYKSIADYYGFNCYGCEQNCCRTHFYHHTLIECFYLLAGFAQLDSKMLPQQEQTDIMCPLNHNGLCCLYDFRPMICRLHGIPHEWHHPVRGLVRGSGCHAFTSACSSKDFIFDRTPFYLQMAELEKELKQKHDLKVKFKMTVAQILGLLKVK